MDSTKNIKEKSKKKSLPLDPNERLSLGQRFKSKLKSTQTWTRTGVNIFRFLLMLGVSFVIIYPFIVQICQSIMSYNDATSKTVNLIAMNPTLEIYQNIFTEGRYMEAFVNTLSLSLICAIIQMLVACLVGYGLAKFKFKGNGIIMILVIFTMIVPHRALSFIMRQQFNSFDLFTSTTIGWKGILELLTGETIELGNSFAPLIILSICGLAFKNGLYIYLMRQFFKGIPDELEESAYVDGSGTVRTFFQIILPLAIPMMITVFLFAFSWQWTDQFYTGTFFIGSPSDPIPTPVLMSDVVGFGASDLGEVYTKQTPEYIQIYENTAGIMIIAPLVVLYLFCQRYLVQGIERSGITG